MLNIVTDSCVDLSSELISRYKIKIVPLKVFINNQTLIDGEISLSELFSRVDKSGELPKTSAPSVADFVQAFDTDEETIYIGISAKLSGTNQNAILARQQLPNRAISIIDSLNLSAGIALQVLKAADMRDDGVPASQISKEILEIREKVKTSFIIDTMDYLYKGGRCTALQAIAGSVLKIRPIIEVRMDGTMGVKEKTRGARIKGLTTLVEDFKSHLPNVDFRRVFITHTGCDQDAEWIKKELLGAAPIEEILITTAGATIASHCGPNTIGILFITK